MRSEATRTLDRIDALPVGRGLLEGYLFGRGDLDSGHAGLGLDYGHRVSVRSSVFARATAGYQYGAESGVVVDALAGWRMRF